MVSSETKLNRESIMREAVTAVLVHGDEVFVIKRQDYLRAFPGYYAFPGGKVDEEDAGFSYNHPQLAQFRPERIRALIRVGRGVGLRPGTGY